MTRTIRPPTGLFLNYAKPSREDSIIPRNTLWQGHVSMLSTVINELITATVRHGFREISTTSRWAAFHLSRAARDRRSRDHILANSQAAVAGQSATPSCVPRHRAE